MSDRLDAQIRDLYAELTAAAPPLPPLPTRVAVELPRSRRVLRIAVTAAVWVAVLGVGALLVSQIQFGDDEAAFDTTTTAAAAATTTTDEPGPVPDLDMACTSLVESLESELAAPPASAEEIEVAFDIIATSMADIARLAESTAVQGQAEEVLAAIERASYAEVVTELDVLAGMLVDGGATQCADLAAQL